MCDIYGNEGFKSNRIKRIFFKYRNKNKATNVLAFPIQESIENNNYIDAVDGKITFFSSMDPQKSMKSIAFPEFNMIF